MSSQALNWAVREVKLRSAHQKVLLIYLADYANAEHTSWPGSKRMARELGWPYSSVRDHLAKMCRDRPDVIRKEARHDESGRQTSNVYRLNVLGNWTCAPDDEDVPESGQGGVPAAQEGVPESRQGEVPESRHPGAGSTAGGGAEIPAGGGAEIPAGGGAEIPAGGGAEIPAGQKSQLLESTTGGNNKEGTAGPEAASRSGPPADSGEPVKGDFQSQGHIHNIECECHPDPLRPKIDGERDDSPAVVLFPLNASKDGRPFALTERLLERLERDYPAVDALRFARHMRNWCLTRPRNRKTPGGIAAALVGWFEREQNQARAGKGDFVRAERPAEPEVPPPDYGTCECGQPFGNTFFRSKGKCHACCNAELKTGTG